MSGVPNPYSLHVHPYPTRFHGPIYTRPVFGMPWQWAPQSVFKPNDLYNGGGGMNGLGAPYEAEKEALLYNTGEGVFRPGGSGGGIFDNSIAGIFGGVKKAIGALGLGATSPYPEIPYQCWSQTGFKDCSDRNFAAAQQQCYSYTKEQIEGPPAYWGTVDECAKDTAARTISSCLDHYCKAYAAATTGASYPWGVYSADTKALQEATNTALKSAGYCPLTVDGKLGPATCGARQTLGLSVPSTCTSFKAPSKGPCATTSYVASSTTSSKLTPEQQAAMTASMTGGSTDWKRYAAFGVGALAVVGAAWYFNKKKGHR